MDLLLLTQKNLNIFRNSLRSSFGAGIICEKVLAELQQVNNSAIDHPHHSIFFPVFLNKKTFD